MYGQCAETLFVVVGSEFPVFALNSPPPLLLTSGFFSEHGYARVYVYQSMNIFVYFFISFNILLVA